MAWYGRTWRNIGNVYLWTIKVLENLGADQADVARAGSPVVASLGAVAEEPDASHRTADKHAAEEEVPVEDERCQELVNDEEHHESAKAEIITKKRQKHV